MLEGKRVRQLTAILEGIAVTFLVLLLTLYGVSKLALAQFFTRLSWLDARVWQLGEFEFIWTVYNQSKAYQFFAGLVETGVAVLLLFKRTRKLGALLAVPVFGNLVALNVGYDLAALDEALAGLVPSLFLVLLYFPAYKAFFWDTTSNSGAHSLFGQRTRRVGFITKYAVVLIGLIGTLLLLSPKFQMRVKPPLYGKWRIASVTGAASALPADLTPGSYFYFESLNEFVVRHEDAFNFGTYTFDPQTHQIEIFAYNADLRAYNEMSLGHLSRARLYTPENTRFSLKGAYALDSGRSLTIRSRLQKDSLTIELRAEPLNALTPADTVTS
jgi:hypothetical protein